MTQRRTILIHRYFLPLFAALFIFLSGPSAALACFFNSSCAAEAVFSAYESKKPIEKNFGGLSKGAALRAQKLFTKKLSSSLGAVIGYKAALTNPAMQTRFNTNAPVLGILLRGMIYENNAAISPAFGARLMLEGDIFVKVADEGINAATTPEEIASHLDAIIPFIELPDLYFAPGIKLDSSDITAINAGARSGVMGDIFPIDANSKATIERLGAITIEIYDGNGTLLRSGKASSIMGHPINAVLWIKNEIRRRGGKLKKGDLLSLGSLTDFLTPTPGLKIKAVYKGIDEGKDYEMFVNFQDK